MPDAMDAAQQLAMDAVSAALDARARTPQAQGLDECERVDCSLAIAPARKALGARLCLECKRAEERTQGGQGIGARR